VWDVNTLKCLATLTGHSGAVRALAASSKRVFSGSDDTTIKVRCKVLPYVNVASRPLSAAFAAPSAEGLSSLIVYL
jgi:WD40 repeat protein